MRKIICLSVMLCFLSAGCFGGPPLERDDVGMTTGPDMSPKPLVTGLGQRDAEREPVAAATPPLWPKPEPQAASSMPSPSSAPSPAVVQPAPSPSIAAAPTPQEKSPAPAHASKRKSAQPAPPKAKQKPKPQGKEKSASVDTGRTARKEMSLTELRSKYAETFIFSGSAGRKRIALTFDDAPDTVYTPQVLDILKRHNVKATFFVVGHRASMHPEMVKRMIREGHVVGNHSYGHSLLKKLPESKFIQEIEKTEQVLLPLVGYTPKLIRPPYGAVNDEQLAWLANHGYLTVNWNVDPEDWKGVSSEEVLDRSLTAARPGSIILMHCATGEGGSLKGTVGALPDLIVKLKSNGFELVTLPDLLQVAKNK